MDDRERECQLIFWFTFTTVISIKPVSMDQQSGILQDSVLVCLTDFWLSVNHKRYNTNSTEAIITSNYHNRTRTFTEAHLNSSLLSMKLHLKFNLHIGTLHLLHSNVAWFCREQYCKLKRNKQLPRIDFELVQATSVLVCEVLSTLLSVSLARLWLYGSRSKLQPHAHWT